MTAKVAIIGAGIAGLAAARRLREAGARPVLFDKSRGLGGRMATRRADGLQFDHGAQHFSARGPRFRALVEGWAATGRAAEWFEGGWVGTPGMSAPARAMAEGLSVIGECAVAGLRRGPDGWALETEDGPAPAAENGRFDAVILAIPAPQAMPLAASAGAALPELARVRYAPCWALMLGWDGSARLPEDRMRAPSADIAWIARNASKPGRDAGRETAVVHASPEWSRAHLELTPEAAAEALCARFRALTGVEAAPSHARAHRWRYALVEEAAGAPCLWDPSARVAACGDWALGPRIEAAFDSGEAAADAVLGAA